MNLEDLMDAWQSQDASPLYRVDKTLLLVALREEQVKLERERRIERWTTMLASVVFIGGIALFLALLLYGDDGVTGWDVAIALVGVAAALVWGGAMYVRHRAQMLLEGGFSESVRDQIEKRLVQLEEQVKWSVRLANVLVAALPPAICATALLLAIWRMNDMAVGEDWPFLVGLILVCVYSSAVSVWKVRRSVQSDLLPRKRRLEALLREFGREE